MLEHLLACEHLVQYEPCTPNITFLVVGFEIEDLRGRIKGSADSFGHLGLDIPSESEISNFEFSVFIQHQVVRLEVPMHFIYI